MTLNEALERIVQLTNENLTILDTINKSFTTKSEHLALTVDQRQYTIPSFIALENKISTLQQNFENVVNAPNTGECFMYFDGTSQRVQLAGYSTSPNGLTLDSNITTFSVHNNDIFKDFVTPKPYLRFDVSSLSNAIKDVSVKKVVLKNTELIDAVKAMTADGNGNTVGNGVIMLPVSYGDLYRKLYVYTEDTDYVDYDRTVRMPLRAQNCTGTYRIVSVDANYTDANFEEYYELTLDRDLKYTINDDTIERDIHIGDELVTYNDKVKMQITNILPLTRKITVKMLENGYADLVAGNSDMALLKFFRPIDFDREKHIDVTLEEDRYICIFIAGINDTTNVRAPWSTGVFIDTSLLVLDSDGLTPFSNYYINNVNNIGDTLFDITHMMNSSLYNMSVEQLDAITQYQPVIDAEKLIVTQINKHLNDSDSVKTIRSLYAQKSRYKNELESTQRSIDNINDILTSTSFSTNNNARTMYEVQLAELNTTKSRLAESIVNVSNEINETVNSSDTPIENAKYHIRGFVDCVIPAQFIPVGTPFDVIAIECEYRYKNRNKMAGNAETIATSDSSANYICTDWVRMPSIMRWKHYFGDNGQIEWVLDDDNDTKNETSFNQIDIPITQGEVVDIRYRWVYSLGFPFTAVRSDWSEIYTQEFPEEYNKDVPVLTIIEENNNEIQKNVYTTMLKELGITPHVDDKVIDQNLVYFHQPEHIASGFYTEERRIIPLRDKLMSMDSVLSDMIAEVYGSYTSNLSVTLSDNINTITLTPDINNRFTVEDYSSNTNTIPLSDIIGGSPVDVGVAMSSLTLTITNIGTMTLKLHTLFPGDPTKVLNQSTSSPVFGGDNRWGATNNFDGVWIQTSDSLNTTNIDLARECARQQVENQVIYFRTGDTMGTLDYYEQTQGGMDVATIFNSSTNTWNPFDPNTTNHKTLDTLWAITPFVNGLAQNSAIATALTNMTSVFNTPSGTNANSYVKYSSLYPYIVNNNTFFLPGGTTYVTLRPGDSISIPLCFYYCLATPTNAQNRSTSVTQLSTSQSMAFDLRTSLFRDPVTYRFTIDANNTNSVAYRTLRGLAQGRNQLPVASSTLSGVSAASLINGRQGN